MLIVVERNTKVKVRTINRYINDKGLQQSFANLTCEVDMYEPPI